MALPWKKEVKETHKEISQVSKQPEKLSDFDVLPVSETSEKKTEQPVVLSETVEPTQVTEQIGEVIREAVVPSSTVAVPVVQPVIKDEFTKEIENILEIAQKYPESKGLPSVKAKGKCQSDQSKRRCS